MTNALIIFGGVSSEHDISLISARSVIKNAPKDKYNLILLGITKDGRWFRYTGSEDLLPGDKWLEDESLITKAFISPERGDHLLYVFGEKTEKIKIDVVFPVLHGKNGEDGTIQGFLQMAGIPYVGCDMISSANCMDKALTNTLADSAGIPQAKWTSATKHKYNSMKDAFLKNSANYLGFPIFVKPANAGSSVGVSKAENYDGLRAAAEKAFEHDDIIVLEEAVDGEEVEVAVLGNEEPVASVAGQIVSHGGFYDYDSKYVNDSSELFIPAKISDEKMKALRFAAIEVYQALGCSGLARVDFFIRRSDGKIMLNEINTVPGFTSISMYPKLFEASGIPYSELIDRLFSLAISKWS